MGIAAKVMCTCELFSTLGLLVACGSGMVVDMGNIKDNIVRMQKMKESRRINASRKGKEDFAFFEEV
jgi:hypothetical protein